MQVDNEGAMYFRDGVYDQEFYENFDGYVGEKVTVSANVDEILNNKAFTIAGTDETTVRIRMVNSDSVAVATFPTPRSSASRSAAPGSPAATTAGGARSTSTTDGCAPATWARSMPPGP